MDFIFEEDMDDVGSDIEAYCPKCKGDVGHTVITKYEDEVRRVQCSTCGDVHAFRKPRGEIEEEIPEPVAAKKRATAKKPTWEEAHAKAGNKALNHARPYSIRDRYQEADIVSHPKFGIGFVTEISENKAEVTFQDERRVLVHNRPDLASQMPAIASVPAPRDDKRSKKGKKRAPEPAQVQVQVKKGGKAAAVAAPPPAAAKSGKPVKPAHPAHPAHVHALDERKKPEPKGAAAAVQGKAERAKAVAAKKGAAKGKPVAAKPAASKSSKPAAKKGAAARRAARPASAAKVKAKKAKAR